MSEPLAEPEKSLDCSALPIQTRPGTEDLVGRRWRVTSPRSDGNAQTRPEDEVVTDDERLLVDREAAIAR